MSNDQDALDHLRGWLNIIAERRDQEALEEASLIKRQAAAAGRLASGSTLQGLIRHVGDDLRIRSELFRRALDDTWRSYRPEASASRAAQTMLADFLAEAAAAQANAVRASVSALGLSGLPQTVWDGLQAEVEHAKQRQWLQLREWVMTQKHTDQPAGSTQTTTINLNGNNNRIVAGLMNSSANVRLDEGSEAQITAALATVRAALESTRALPEADASETVEMIRDAEAELARDQPNKRKLRASLEGVATSIQTVGALGEAYNVLKTAMALIGIPLP